MSKEAHYSLQKIGDIQNIETRIIDTLEMGQMDTEDLKRKMSSKSPALVAVAIGGTFKGAIDDQSAISDAIAQVNPPAGGPADHIKKTRGQRLIKFLEVSLWNLCRLWV